MILVTVGTQKPFPRLLQAVNAWAVDHPEEHVTAQIGVDDADSYPALQCQQFMSATEFHDYVLTADVIIAHAGVGTMLTAQKAGKPLVIVPRRARLNEHRNDHQLESALAFKAIPGVFVMDDMTDLTEVIREARAGPPPPLRGDRPELVRLSQCVAEFIRDHGR